MKYLLFVTIDELGHTKILAACFIKNEDITTFDWCYRKFQESFGGAEYRATVIFTDGDQAMITAAEELAVEGGIWDGIKILRCVFHLWKNFFNYLVLYYSNNASSKKKWNKVTQRFWRFIHETDEQLQPLFEEDWKVFSDGIKNHVKEINGAQKILLDNKMKNAAKKIKSSSQTNAASENSQANASSENYPLVALQPR